MAWTTTGHRKGGVKLEHREFVVKRPILIAAFAWVLVAVPGRAADDGPLINTGALPVVAAPGFRLSLDATWSVAHGSWTPKDGVLHAVELPENKHAAVLHHRVGLQSATIECDFRFDGQGTFLIGCDGTKHVGRVVVRAGGMDIAEDSVKPSHVLASLKRPVTAGTWHHLRVEWRDDLMSARLDGRNLHARHDYLRTPKTRSWLAVAKEVKIRDLKISGIGK